MDYHNYFKRFYLKDVTRYDADIVFQFVCWMEYLDNIIWLGKIFPRVNVHEGNERAFRLACKCGNVETAVWPKNNYPKINIRVRNDYAFLTACDENFLDLTKYLASNLSRLHNHANSNKYMDAIENVPPQSNDLSSLFD